MDFSLTRVGYDYSHPKEFLINRPKGTDDFLLLFFVTPVKIFLNHAFVTVNENSFIIYTPLTPHIYGNSDKGFTNDFVHFTGSDVKSLLTELDLPLNTVFTVSNHDFVRPFINNLESEFLERKRCWERTSQGLFLSNMVDLSRAYHNDRNYSLNPYKSELFKEFKIARVKILSSCENPWNVSEMAKLIGMSRTRFSVLYKEFFNVSPKDDLITARIRRAKYLLSSNTMSVSDVAFTVGYDNIYHFNRQFKEIVGVSPGKYNK